MYRTEDFLSLSFECNHQLCWLNSVITWIYHQVRAYEGWYNIQPWSVGSASWCRLDKFRVLQVFLHTTRVASEHPLAQVSSGSSWKDYMSWLHEILCYIVQWSKNLQSSHECTVLYRKLFLTQQTKNITSEYAFISFLSPMFMIPYS